MNAEMLRSRFARIGARFELSPVREASDRSVGPLTLDVRSDSAGEYFEAGVRPNAVELDVVDIRRREQHLLLWSKEIPERSPSLLRESYFLCGHDEQHWFVAAVPESAGPLGNVFAAMEALKPAEVIAAQRRQGLKGMARYSRKNAAFIRQGEWFFIPRPNLRVDSGAVVYHEPLSRGVGSKPHLAECLYRQGGEMVYVCDLYPGGVSPREHQRLSRGLGKEWNWRRMYRNPTAFVKGTVSHPDHKTILLQVWHQVVMNTENQSQAMRHVVFLD